MSETAIASFLYKAPAYAEKLERYSFRADRNQSIFNKLDELIALIAEKGRLVSRGAE